MVKVIFYTDTPIFGGAERHMTLLAKTLDPEKYKVTIVISAYKELNKWHEELKNAGINVIRLKVFHKHDPNHLFILKKLLATEKPDILHLHIWNPASCRYAFFAANPKITKIVATEHDPFALKGIKKIFKNKCLKLTNHVITVSNANKDFMIKEYPTIKDRISVIHNGIDLQKFEKEILRFSSQDKQKIRTLFNADSGSFVILTVAALHPRKGLKYLIQAFHDILPYIPESKLIIVGEGPQKTDLENLIKKLDIVNKVMLLCTRNDIPKILKSSDLFILPSLKEAFGLVILEAMAAQIPIIASNVGGIPEIIQNFKTGYLIEPAKSNAIAEKIVEIYNNKAQSEKISFIASHEVKKFDATTMAKKTAEIYDQLLNGTNS